MFNQINPSELHLHEASVSDTVASFVGLHLYIHISNGFVTSKDYDKRDDFELI